MASPDPLETLSRRLRTAPVVPGFGLRLYPDGDPRASMLLGLLSESELPGPVRRTTRILVEAVRDRPQLLPNVDFALAAMAHAYHFPPDAGEAIFAIARIAGWIAHALEEYTEKPLRFRQLATYEGPGPATR
jgi:citrate synthase